MESTLTYEIGKKNRNLPVTIHKKISDKQSVGCTFHWHEEIEFYVVVKGGVNLLCNGSCFSVNSGDICAINWCEPHKSISFLDNTEHYIVKVDLQSPVFSYYDIAKNHFDNIIKNNPALFNIFMEIINLYFDDKEHNKLSIIGKMYCILQELLHISNNAIENNYQNLIYTKEILMYIHDNASNNIKLSDISTHIGISSSHMCRVFKQHTGMTIIEYINKIKFNIAINYIEKGMKISDASGLVGFEDYNYFSRMFKKVMGESPSKYKQKA